MILVDTGYFIALLKPADSLHSRAKRWSSAINEQLLLSEYVLWEAVNSFSSPPNKAKIHLALEQMRSDTKCLWVPASQSLLDSSLSAHRSRPDKDWSLTDCSSFVIMSEHRIARALTHDHHFEQAGFEALLRRDPP